jgi:hypothetical protein
MAGGTFPQDSRKGRGMADGDARTTLLAEAALDVEAEV